MDGFDESTIRNPVVADALSKLKEKDSIMDLHVVQNLRTVLGGGVAPNIPIHLLASTYRGYAQMCNLVGSWLEDLDVSAPEVDRIAIDYLKDVTLRHFDSNKMDILLAEESGTTPPWLKFMIQVPEWRQLIYKLSEMNPRCMLLNFAIRLICDAGYSAEIARLQSVSNFFGVFNQVLTDVVTRATDMGAEQIIAELPNFKAMCCQSEQTYLYSSALLLSLSEGQQAPPHCAHVFKRLRQEIERHAMTLEPKIVRKMSDLLTHTITNHSDIASSLSSVITSGKTSPGDITKFYTAYQSVCPPPISLLQSPPLFEILIKDLFDQSHHHVNQEFLEKYIFVLAVASAGGQNQPHFKDTLAAINKCVRLCQARAAALAVDKTICELYKHISHPAVAMGSLFWIETRFSQGLPTNGTRHMLELIKVIATEHPLLRGACVEAVSKCFHGKYDLDPLKENDLKRTFLDVMLHVLFLGHFSPVLTFVDQCKDSMDLSVLRYFILQVTEHITGPYSAPFLSAFKDLLATERVRDCLGALDQEKNDLFQAFLRSVLSDETEDTKDLREELISIFVGL